MNALAAYGLLAHGLIFGALVSLLPLGILRPRAALLGTTVALLAGIAPAMHAAFGTPSVSLLLLALLRLLPGPGGAAAPSPLDYPSALLLVAFAALFYPTALGWGPFSQFGDFDLYRLGYQPAPLLIALLPLGLALWLRRLAGWLLILSLDLIAYASGIFANLWDVLIDPVLVFVAACLVLRQQVLRVMAARHR